MSLVILTEPQQHALHAIGHASKGLPIHPVGSGGGFTARVRRSLASNTALVERFNGPDGQPWVRLTAAGLAFVQATALPSDGDGESS